MKPSAPFALALSLLAVAAAAAVPTGTDAPAPPAPASPTGEVRPVMAVFFGNVEALYPYLISEQAFAAPASAAEIQLRLDALAADATVLRHMRSLRSPGYALGATVLHDHLVRTVEAFRAGEKTHARWLLGQTLQGCIACHAQQPQRQPPGLAVPSGVLRGTTLEKADLMFATRGFDAALELYAAVVDRFPEGAAAGEAGDQSTLDVALARTLAIGLRVRRAPAPTARAFEQFLANPKLPVATRQLLGSWVVELRRPELLPTFDARTARPAQVHAYAKAVLDREWRRTTLLASPAFAARYLVLSGVLFEYVGGNPAARAPEEAAQALLWLAKCDRAVDSDPFFSMADLYLEDCIRRAPHTSVAARCAAELEAGVVFEFTGSRGTDVPAEVARKLAELKLLSR